MRDRGGRRAERGLPGKTGRVGVRGLVLALAIGAIIPVAAGVTVLAGVTGADEESLAELDARFEEASETMRSREAAAAFRDDYTALATRAAGTPDGLGAELWLLRMRWWAQTEGEDKGEAATHARRLIADYPESAELKRIPEFGYLYSLEDLEAISGELARVTPHREVKAWCLHATGSKLFRSDEERALTFFGALRDRYGDVAFRATTFGEIASAYLDRHDASALAIGAVAPDIVGTDVHGEPMRLSDYRGKVVVLDFWGDW